MGRQSSLLVPAEIYGAAASARWGCHSANVIGTRWMWQGGDRGRGEAGAGGGLEWRRPQAPGRPLPSQPLPMGSTAPPRPRPSSLNPPTCQGGGTDRSGRDWGAWVPTCLPRRPLRFPPLLLSPALQGFRPLPPPSHHPLSLPPPPVHASNKLGPIGLPWPLCEAAPARPTGRSLYRSRNTPEIYITP